MKFLPSSAVVILPSLLSADAFTCSQSKSQTATRCTFLQAQKIGNADFGAGADFDPSAMGGSSIQQIEFKIYSDGRVEETVRGVKGNNCHKVTEKINESLGKVIESAPTEEAYEQEVIISQQETLSNSVSTEDSWEGQSSW